MGKQPVLPDFSGKTVAVSGGAGFIGSSLSWLLLKAGAHVRVIDNLSTGKKSNLAFGASSETGFDLTFIQADIRDEEAMRSALKGCEFVFHLAAFVSVPLSVEDPNQANDINVAGSLKLLQAAEACGVKRVILSSSCAVYGDDPKLPKRETDRPQPVSPYATGKLAMEHYAENFSRLFNLECVNLRYFNVYGPKQDPNSPYAAAAPIFVKRILEGKAPVIFGDGKQTRDFIFVEDAARANLLAAIADEEATALPINIAGGKSVSINELAKEILRIMESKLSPNYENKRKGDVLHSLADTNRAQSILGFRPLTGLDEGLYPTILWYQKYFKESNS